MSYAANLIDAIRANNDGCSDYRAAKLLGVSRQLVSSMRSGSRKMTEDVAIKAAELANEDPKIALIRLNKETENPKVRQYWEEIEQQIQ